MSEKRGARNDRRRREDQETRGKGILSEGRRIPNEEGRTPAREEESWTRMRISAREKEKVRKRHGRTRMEISAREKGTSTTIYLRVFYPGRGSIVLIELLYASPD
jgi:hypothetical protein